MPRAASYLERMKGDNADDEAGMTVLPEFSLGEVKAQLASLVAERSTTSCGRTHGQHLWSFMAGHRAFPGPWPMRRVQGRAPVRDR